ncbi:unnamed protein product [Closterium sp. Naga37s-1]|nr:unnamed protein product [Closterium sp. Naga37s-1]
MVIYGTVDLDEGERAVGGLKEEDDKGSGFGESESEDGEGSEWDSVDWSGGEDGEGSEVEDGEGSVREGEGQHSAPLPRRHVVAGP